MEVTSQQIRQQARDALADPALQRALGNLRAGFPGKRAAAIARLPEFDALRDAARDLKDHCLENLDFYLETFEANVTRQGGQVHFARDAAEACAVILDICRRSDARTVTKGKSMVSEEIGLNAHLEANGIEPIETDLGEYILQLRGEHPSHIIAPAIHLNLDQIADAFHSSHARYGKTERLEDPRALMNEARSILRDKFLRADVGITGANFCVAETGSTIIVTNEGNGDLTQTLPRVHVVITSIDKVVPTLEDATLLLRLLARSATGQEMTVYNTLSTGPRRADDLDGPEAFHVVLLDNGRSQMLGTELQPMLRCIRCSACMNHCPVYGAIGGHAYGWVYPGPMGSVLTPQLVGLEQASQLPNASTLCGRCEEVCPVRIPLPRLLRHWREREQAAGLQPRAQRWGLGAWSWLTRHPRAYRAATRLAGRLLAALGRDGRIRALPLASGWTDTRDLPAPAARGFLDQWRDRRRPS